MNKAEQLFCTKLSGHLRKTKPEHSMAIEVKECDKRFAFADIRKGQLGTLRKLYQGIPIVHKISDSSMGSKLVDLLYLHPDGINVHPMLAIKFTGHRKSFLLPFHIIDGFMQRNYKSITPDDLKSDLHQIKFK